MKKAWEGFKEGQWQEEINVRDFIQKNYTPYDGDDSFLEGISENSDALWTRSLELLKEESKVRVLDIEMEAISGIDNFEPGYIIKEKEDIVGLQTDAPLKRIINPYGGIRLVDNILDIYDRKMDEKTNEFFHKYTKTHNQGVFDAYTPEIRKYRTTGLLTGLPDAYGRGRIIGDYRRVALYGIDYLIEEKKKDLSEITNITSETIQLREEVSEQIRALAEIKSMAAKYGFDIGEPAVCQ